MILNIGPVLLVLARLIAPVLFGAEDLCLRLVMVDDALSRLNSFLMLHRGPTAAAVNAGRSAVWVEPACVDLGALAPSPAQETLGSETMNSAASHASARASVQALSSAVLQGVRGHRSRTVGYRKPLKSSSPFIPTRS